MTRILTTYSQRQRLDCLFDSHEIDVNLLMCRMSRVFPRGADHILVNDTQQDRQKVKKLILDGGSLAFNELCSVLKADSRFGWAAYPDLLKTLTKDAEKQLYRWVWIWSENGDGDGHIMDRGQTWFTDIESCRVEGKKHKPSYYTFDGPGAPIAVLCVESVCPCHVHDPLSFQVTRPCWCNRTSKGSSGSEEPSSKKPRCDGVAESTSTTSMECDLLQSRGENVRDEQEMEVDEYHIYENGHVLLIDGLTIHKLLEVGFSFPPTYKYRILETGKVFHSQRKDILAAYMEEKGRFARYKSPAFHISSEAGLGMF